MSGIELPMIDLGGQTVAIADLHLDPFDGEACAAFAAWTRGLAGTRLLVLGDLFDAWVGPAHETAPGATQVLAAFEQLAGRQVDVHVLQGNRDFLLGPSFARRAACRVYADGLVGIVPEGPRVLFLHGDELCTKDLAYQRLRRITHSWPVQQWGPRLPLFLSRRLAARLRRYSKKAVAMKVSADKEIQGSAALVELRAKACAWLVCGHVHESRDEPLGETGRWLILDAWGMGPRDALLIRPGHEPALLSSAGVSSAGISRTAPIQ